MVNLKEQYQRELHNWLIHVKQMLDNIQRNNTATLEEKLAALEAIGKQIPEAKRRLIFLINTQKGN